MRSDAWPDAIAACADPRRAAQYLGQLQASPAAAGLRRPSREQARVLCALLGGSQALSELLVAHPDWLPALIDTEGLQFPRQPQGIQNEVGKWLESALSNRDYAGALGRLREFKQREMLRIATRDLARLGTVSTITKELSDLADLCLSSVHRICLAELTERLGQPYHLDAQDRWQPTAFCVLGMGKLGGQELNYSSDVDVLFVYSEEGWVFRQPPRRGEPHGKGMTSHQFYKRLAEAIISEVGRLAPEGMLYRIDLRLRPEGKAGPLARSLPGYENFYAQWGQTWERMMLIKARGVAGAPALAAEFLDAVQSFRFPRSLNAQVLREIAAMKERIENEVVRAGEIDRNVKLGRGGIREIEFIAQTQQILNVGRHPFLAGTQTVGTLQKLVRYKLMPGEIAEGLIAAYEFLRDLEHRLQMENNLQTHTMPTERRARERLARQMGFETVRPFEQALDRHRNHVRRVYEGLLKRDADEVEAPTLPEFEGHEEEWHKRLADHGFRDPTQALRLAIGFVHGPGFGLVSRRTFEFARQLFARLLALCPGVQTLARPAAEKHPDGNPSARRLSDPDRVLTRLESFVAAYGARSMLFETWAGNPSLFELLVLLFDRSEFLAETAIRTPDLVDELEQSGRLRRSKTVETTLKDLQHGANDADQRIWLRRYHQAELMRIGLRDILGLADFEQNLIELSALAEACLKYALEVVLRKHKLADSPVAIVGLGKLGGGELTYGSDLDLMFVADSRVRNLAQLQRVAIDLMDLLGSKGEAAIFSVDARLRPDGEKGLLLNTLKAYEDYYLQRAQLWEIQALSRCRAIAGPDELKRRFQELAARVTNFSQPAAAARFGDWKKEIARMRQRIERERTPPGREPIAIKTGAGGLIDAEFIAQACCLEHGWQEPNTLKALELARERKIMPQGEANLLIENYRRLRRVEGILRRWSYVGETTLPEDPAPLYRVAVRCGFDTTAAFMAAVARYRENIRRVYLTQFPSAL